MKKEFENDDPMELQEMVLNGDPWLQAKMLIEEFLMMGTTPQELLRIFQDPFYRGTHGLYRQLGEATVRNLIQDCVQRS